MRYAGGAKRETEVWTDQSFCRRRHGIVGTYNNNSAPSIPSGTSTSGGGSSGSGTNLNPWGYGNYDNSQDVNYEDIARYYAN